VAFIHAPIASCVSLASSQGISIRPLVPPTHTHDAFARATQRFYMSGTLGGGSDLQRSYGVEKISIVRAKSPHWGRPLRRVLAEASALPLSSLGPAPFRLMPASLDVGKLSSHLFRVRRVKTATTPTALELNQTAIKHGSQSSSHRGMFTSL
jgi:hypothetical protein